MINAETETGRGLVRRMSLALIAFAIAAALTINLCNAAISMYFERSRLAVNMTDPRVSTIAPSPTQGPRHHREGGNESQSRPPASSRHPSQRFKHSGQAKTRPPPPSFSTRSNRLPKSVEYDNIHATEVLTLTLGRSDETLFYDSVRKPDEVARLPLQFRRQLARDELSAFNDILKTLSQVASRNNIPLFMNFGTLLGSFRHQSIIPWDCDADVSMPYSQRDRIWSLLNGIGGGYTAINGGGSVFRLAGPGSKIRSPHSGAQLFPLADIIMYYENTTHLWFWSRPSNIIYKREDVFPLHKRPLGSINLPAPRDSLSCLRHAYGNYDKCSTGGYDHRLCQSMPQQKLPCKALSRAYAFVHRSLASDGVVWERLVLGNRTLRSGPTRELPLTAVVSPFALKPAKTH